MPTLHHDGKAITVPDDVAGDYTSQGWQDVPSAPAPRRARRARTRKPKPPATPES